MSRQDPQLGVRVPRQIIEGIKALAESENRTFTGQIVKILKDALKKKVVKDEKLM